MRGRGFVLWGVVVFIVAACVAPDVSATLIAGSTGTTYLTDSNEGYTINIQVDYGVYDGASADDPLGDNGDMQIGFVLTHLGFESGHESDTVLNMGRFIAHNPDGVVFTSTEYGFKDDPLVMGDIAPHSPYGAVGIETGDVVFNFVGEYTYQADFVTGNVSMILAVSMTPQELPENILIEIDELYNPVKEVHILVPIVIPEPTSVALLGIGASLLSIRRKDKAAI